MKARHTKGLAVVHFGNAMGHCISAEIESIFSVCKDNGLSQPVAECVAIANGLSLDDFLNVANN